MMKKIAVVGWQSWSHCGKDGKWLARKKCYSPFGNNNTQLSIPAKQKKSKRITGWNSWNAYGTNISAEKIRRVAQWIQARKKKIPLEYIVIDDGWTLWGDWQAPDPVKFPLGISGMSHELQTMGFKTGLWIAPFLVDPRSKLYAEHPEWLVRDRHGNAIDGRKNYFFDWLLPQKKYLLDLENPSAYAYVLDSLRQVIKKWGIELIKADFLYAGHFNPKYKTSEKPDALLRQLLRDIKAIDEDVHLLACGCPLAPAAGVVDSMRISDDIIIPSLKGVPVLNSLLHSALLRQLQTNFQERQQTNELWQLDPDMFVCHPGFGLSNQQVNNFQQIVTAADGVVMLGDDLPELTEELLEEHIYPLFL